MKRVFTFTLLLLAGFILYPAFFSIWTLFTDPGIRNGGPTKISFKIHKSLSTRLPEYIDDRIESEIATTLTVEEIEATEWPLYGAFFYLRATEKLQAQYENNQTLSSSSPKESGKTAIEASVRLLLDENHAHWVKVYWGENLDPHSNCFYRLLVAGGLGAHHRLTGSTEHLPVLRMHLKALTYHLDQSSHGLIDDYPGQCFPMDVAAAIGIVREYSKIIGEDRIDWAKDALARMLQHSDGKLPAYTADVFTGTIQTPSRGCTNGFGLPFIREADPETGERLYQQYCDRFWKNDSLAQGWREFDMSYSPDWLYFDADAGPVLWSFGTAATGLGLGTARAYRDHEKSSILGCELLATSLPLPNGRLLIPSLVANKEHAPYFPEIVLMYQLSQSSSASDEPGPIPGIFWLITGTQLALGLVLLRFGYKRLRKKN